MNPSELFNIIFLPIIFFIGFITSYEDIKIDKIRNKWIILGLFYSLIVYSSMWALYLLNKKSLLGIKIESLLNQIVQTSDKQIVNILISALVAYLLWHFKMWGAGDAKLFICYSALIPLGQYSKVYFDYYFASFLLLMNTFIPALIFLLATSIWFFIKRLNFKVFKKKFVPTLKEKMEEFKKNQRTKSRILLGFFVFFLFFRILREILRNLLHQILPNQNILILLSLVVFRKLSEFFRKNSKFIGISFLVLIFYFGIKIAHSKTQFFLEIGNIFAKSFLVILFYSIFRKITKKTINFYAEKSGRKTTPFAPWMFLGALITWFF